MKYFVFAMAAFGVPPLAVLLTLNQRWMKYVVWGMVAALCVYNSTAINFFSYEDYRGTSRGMEISVVYLFALAFILTSVGKFKFPGFLPSAGAKLYALYFLLCLPSWSSAANTLFCWLETWKMIMLYVTYLSIRAYLKMTDGVKDVVNAMAVFVLWNFLLVVKDHFAGVYQPHAVFPHQNSMVMAMHVFGNVFFAFYLAQGVGGGKLATLAFVCSAACALRSYSRGAIALMPVSYAITTIVLYAGGTRDGFMKLVRRLVPIALVGLVGLAVMLPRIIERFQGAPEASKNTRIELALCAKEMIMDEPWRGVGINNWGIKINPPYEYAEAAGRIQNRGEDFRDGIVETVYLLVGAECGIPALVAMMVWFLYYLFIAMRLVWRLSGTWYSSIPAGLAGGFIACYLQSSLEWVLRQQINLIVMMIFFALLDHLNANWKRLGKEASAEGRR